MSAGTAPAKETLSEHGFRLPSPSTIGRLRFEEFENA